MGRPSEYTDEIGAALCRAMAEGESLRSICAKDGMPSKSTVMRWLASNDEFRDHYAQARDAQADYWADEIIEISDDSKRDTYVDDNGNVRTDHEVINRSRLRVDTRKWLMARMAPKKYGDRVTTELVGKDGGPVEVADVSDNDVARRIAFMLAKGVQDKPTAH